MINNIGINTVNFPIEKVREFGLGRAEICLGRGNSYESRLAEALRHMGYAEEHGIPYSVHLPIYVEEWYPYDYLSAYFLDPSEDMRKLALRLLDYNLEKLQDFKSEYYVLHFGGIYENLHTGELFNQWINCALEQINTIAEKYDVKVYIEYFGSNKNFKGYLEWIEEVEKYKNIGLLTDLGHLYFASIINDFEFDEALDVLIEKSDGFHIWTTKGKDVYFKSDFYKHYHHIVPRSGQSIEDGWAFDTDKVMEKLKRANKPIIIEASKEYMGEEFFLEGVRECVGLSKDIG